jgi:TolB-like protein/Flp pilus assembly protein TadD
MQSPGPADGESGGGPVASTSPAVRRLSAIMFSDMVGYTALMQEDEARARRDRSRQRQALETHIAENGGRILQYYGDGALSVFDSAIAAVTAAVAIQQTLNREPKVALRTGIHTGDVVYDDEGVFGDGVNVAARVQSLGSAASVLVSEKVYDEIKNQPQLRAVSLGGFDLKNVKRPVEVWAIVAEGLSTPTQKSMPSRARQELRSVAVLPFANMSTDPENEFFSDGITEELINVLTRVNGLQVTARTSSFAFKGRPADIREIATTLGVDTVLEGSVRRAGSRVRITAQLINASSGYHIFSETYDRTLDDIFETQDEIARAIVRAVEDRLTPDRRQPAMSTPRTNAEAHAFYLRGLHEYARWTPEAFRHAIEMFRRAIEIDPDYANAHVGLAIAHSDVARWSQAKVPDNWAEAEAAAKRSLELDASLGTAHMVLALERLLWAWDFDAAYERLQKALSLSPGSAEVRLAYSTYLMLVGEFDRAVEEVDAAGQLDPLSLPVMLARSDARLNAGRTTEAIEIADRILEQDPSFRAAINLRGIALAIEGRLDEAASELDRVVAITGDEYRWLGERGFVYALMGREADTRRNLELLQEKARLHPDQPLEMDFYILHVALREWDSAHDALERAIEKRLSGVLFMVNSAFWVVAREDPGLDAVFRKHGLDRLKKTEAFGEVRRVGS